MIILGTVVRNVGAIITDCIDHLVSVFPTHSNNVAIIIVESDSSDDTLLKLKSLACRYPNVLSYYSLGMLSKSIPHRIDRICYCRNILHQLFLRKKYLYPSTSNSFIFIFDCDRNPIFSLTYLQVTALLSKLECDHSINGLFPFSVPYFYDITALRSNNWLDSDPWSDFADLIALGSFMHAFKYIQNLQRSLPSTQVLIPVKSAFGGFAIYRSIPDSLFPYQSSSSRHGRVCEHISFNSHLQALYIDPSWQLPAPKEHLIRFNARLKFLCALSCITNKNLVSLSY